MSEDDDRDDRDEGNGDEEFKDFLQRTSEARTAQEFLAETLLDKAREVRKALKATSSAFAAMAGDDLQREKAAAFLEDLRNAYKSTLNGLDCVLYQALDEMEGKNGDNRGNG